MRSNSSRSRLNIRIESIYRKVLLATLARSNGSILVNEYPKSGGTWLSNMISHGAGIHFPQNEFPTLQRSIFHGHYLYRYNGVPTVVLWRDPRDVIISWYHHSLLSGHTNEKLLHANRTALKFDDYKDVSANLPNFIKFTFERQKSPHFNWNMFFDKWSPIRNNVAHTSYERLSADPLLELNSIFEKLEISPSGSLPEAVEKNSFQALSGRDKGVEDSNNFLRKGIVGDWKNNFTPESITALETATEGRLAKYLEFINTIN